MRLSDGIAAGVFVLFVSGCAGAALHDDVTDLYRDRASRIASLVFSKRLGALYEREESLGLDQCKRLPRAAEMSETWTCSDGTLGRVLFELSSDDRWCSVTIVRRDESVEKRLYRRYGRYTRRETLFGELGTRELRKGETVEDLDPSTCMRFSDQVKARYVS